MSISSVNLNNKQANANKRHCETTSKTRYSLGRGGYTIVKISDYAEKRLKRSPLNPSIVIVRSPRLNTPPPARISPENDKQLNLQDKRIEVSVSKALVVKPPIDIRTLAKKYSRDLCETLDLSEADLDLIRDFIQDRSIYPSLEDHKHLNVGFLPLKIEGKEFVLCVRSPLHEENMVQVDCISDSSLNISDGKGSSFTNGVHPQWHAKILAHLKTPEVQSFVRATVNSTRSRAAELWTRVYENSQAYCKVLDLTEEDIKKVYDHFSRANLTIPVENRSFTLSVQNTSTRSYEKVKNLLNPQDRGWKKLVLARCKNDDDLNSSMGSGTGFINAIDPAYLERLLEQLREKAIRLFPHGMIMRAYCQRKNLWNEVVKNSQEYCNELGLVPGDLKKLEQITPNKIYPSLADRTSTAFLTVETTHWKGVVETDDQECDFEVDNQKFAFTVPQREEFALYAELICGMDGWKTIIQPVCTTNPSLNQAVGRGTALTNKIPYSCHRAILNALISMIKGIEAAALQNNG